MIDKEIKAQFDNILVQGNCINMNGHTECADNLYIVLVNYGDGYYDIEMCYKSNKKLFGDLAWRGIRKRIADKMVKELQSITGVSTIMTSKVNETSGLE